MIPAKSQQAAKALELVTKLQSHFAKILTELQAPPAIAGKRTIFQPITWLRDNGNHGGGSRVAYALEPGEGLFNRASINVSQVHYDDEPTRPLGSATAISTIVHPSHPLLPSTHIHISWTEMKMGGGYWRIMGDLNPSIAHEDDKQLFSDAMANAAPNLYREGTKQGELYFNIPVLGRHRGVTHFYLEQYASKNPADDLVLAETFGYAVMNAYGTILAKRLPKLTAPTKAELAAQLSYHTLYLFQVLTLDRGTTSGVLVHDQNDVGIMGSLPAKIDRSLLTSWIPKMPKPQDELLKLIVDGIPASGTIGDQEKINFCAALRTHYNKHPDALDMQARGDIVPPTVKNHS